MRRPESFGQVTAAERRAADLFFAELMGTPLRRRSAGRRRAVEATEQAPEALRLGPLSESEWRGIIRILTTGEVDVGVRLTADAGTNARKVAARIFCTRNALSLPPGDPLVCVLPKVTARDRRVAAIISHVTARGPIIMWQLVPEDDRIRHVMTLLVGTHGYPVNGAAGLVGNLFSESRVLPNRIEGSSRATPMRALGFRGRTPRDFTPDEIVNRNQAARRGPRLPGIGLAQWTDPPRRAGLFGHRFRGVILGPRILFDMDAQVDYLVSELRSPALARVDRVLRAPGVTVAAASDEVLYNFEIPGAILENRRKLPRTDPRVQRVFRQRRAGAARVLGTYAAVQARRAELLDEGVIELGSSMAGESRPTPPSITQVIGLGQAHFTFVLIRSQMTGPGGTYSARFWVLDDALKWIVPNYSGGTTLDQAAAFHEPSDDDVMVIKHGARLHDVRRRLLRLPCTAREAQHAADLIRTRPRDLRGATAEGGPTTRKPSLLLTPHLFNLRFAQADLRIAPQTGLMRLNTRRGLLAASVEYNRRVAREAKRVLDAGGIGSRPYPELLADPGKIWAITHDIGRVRTTTCEKPPRPTRFRYAVNHGWHRPGGKLIQDRGKCHDAAHTDYSQILVVVAGWCEVTRPGASAPVWTETSAVYRSRELGPLVTGGGPRLTKLRYDW